MQPRRRLPLVLHFDRKRTGETIRQRRDRRGVLVPEDLVRRSMPYRKGSAGDPRDRHDLKISDRAERADFQLSPADNRQSRRFHAANPDHPALAAAQKHGGRAGEGKIVNLIGLLPSHRRRVEIAVFRVRLRLIKRLPYCLWILGGEHDAHDLSPEAAMFQDFLTNQLPLPIAVGRQPNPANGTERGPDRLQLAGFVAAGSRFHSIKRFWTQQHGRPALPGGVHVLRLLQRDQMSFGRQNRAVAMAQGGTDVLGLTAFFGDDEVGRHQMLNVWSIAAKVIPSSRPKKSDKAPGQYR